jgi:hypothetical protein
MPKKVLNNTGRPKSRWQQEVRKAVTQRGELKEQKLEENRDRERDRLLGNANEVESAMLQT